VYSREGAGEKGALRGSQTTIPLDRPVENEYNSTWMASEHKSRIQVLQGTLDLIVLRTLATMGPQHAYGIASRLQQVSEDLLNLNQGTLYPALVRLEQQNWIKGSWGTTESNREAKFYAITRAGQKALGEETERWRQLSGLMEKLLGAED
jgi:PadR family transcriptional regulator PadR